MKKVICAFVIMFMMNSCKENHGGLFNEDLQDINQALLTAKRSCGESSLVWLNELLVKAEDDRKFHQHKGNYTGIVSLIPYKGNTLIYTNFAMGSGGIAYYTFDCKGSPFLMPREEAGDIPLQASQRKHVIYSSINF